MAGIKIPVCITIDRASAEAAWEAKRKGLEPQPIRMETEYSDQVTEFGEYSFAHWMLVDYLGLPDFGPYRPTKEKEKDHEKQLSCQPD